MAAGGSPVPGGSPKGPLVANIGTDAPIQPAPEKINKPVAEVSGPQVLKPTVGGLEKFQPVDFAAVKGHAVAERSAGTKTPPAAEMVKKGMD